MTQTDDWGDLKRLAEDAKRLGANGTMLSVDAVLELIAEVERLRANAEKMEKLYRGLSVERGDLQTEFIEMRSERDALKAQVAEERDWQNEIRKVCKEAMGGNTTFIDDDVARAITALKSQRDEMAEALGRAVDGLRRGEASAVFAELTHPDTIAAIRRSADSGARDFRKHSIDAASSPT